MYIPCRSKVYGIEVRFKGVPCQRHDEKVTDEMTVERTPIGVHCIRHSQHVALCQSALRKHAYAIYCIFHGCKNDKFHMKKQQW